MLFQSVHNFFFLSVDLRLKCVEKFLLIIKHLITFLFFKEELVFEEPNFLLKLDNHVLINLGVFSCLVKDIKLPVNSLGYLINFKISILDLSLKSLNFLNQ